MEIPTARVMRENSYRIGFSQVEPYRYYYGAISPLKGLEIDGRITEFIHIPFADQKTGKDKTIDVKYQFYPEGKYMPALALGIMDPHGTRKFPSQYIVASKQIYPLDFTIGFGNGRFGEKPLISSPQGVRVEMFTDTSDWLDESQFFGGIQFSPSEKFALMMEYSPIQYHKQTSDSAQSVHFREPVASKYNFGIRYKPTKWSEIGLSYQRGNEIGFHLSTVFDIGNPLVPIYDPLYRENPAVMNNPLSERLTSGLIYAGFSDIVVVNSADELWIWVQNDKYFYSTGAIGEILRVSIGMLPENIKRIHIILKENGIPQIEISTMRADVEDFHNGKLKANELLYLSDINTDISIKRVGEGKHKKKFKYGVRPSFETFLNDPTGFFKYRFGVSGWMSYHPWAGASFVAGIEGYPFNNVVTTNEPLSIPVRSDIVDYKDEKFVLGRLMFDQINRLTPDLYGRISGGLLEVQYAGIDGEIAAPLYDGRLLLGLSGSAVKKRDSENPLKLKDNPVKDTFTTAFLNTRINIPEIESALDVKAGRFLAGDNGVRFTVSKFIKGVTIWAWYSFTDTSVFSDNFNEGYHDKGIGVSIPLRLFQGTDSKTVYHYSLAPWTRDTGQDIDHFGTLFDFIDRNTKIYIDNDRQMLYR